MNLLGIDMPTWVLDWSGSVLVVISLVFGIHGLLLWRLEHCRDDGGVDFNEHVWYQRMARAYV